MDLPTSRRLILGISGASGAILGIRALEILRGMPEIETHLILTPAARQTIVQETNWTVSQVLQLADISYKPTEIGASIASGSFPTLGMLVLPCSIKTLSAIANSYAADLLTRAADVTLKEGRPLILGVRETPLHRGHLRLMEQAAEAGAIIYPPMPAFYTRPQSLEDIIDQYLGRVFQRMGIDNQLFQQWGGEA